MTRFTTFTILALLLVANTGCWSKVSNWKFSNMFDLDKGMPWDDDEDEVREGTPVRVVSSWVDTVKHTQGEMPRRGFGGRLLFYDEESNDPIKVEGELVVYAFDETNRDPIDNRPTRRFVFPAEQVALQMSKSAIGPSYSFFLPWDQVGGPQLEISLIGRFKPANGPIVVSEQTRHLLPGVILPNSPGAAGQKQLDPAQAKTQQPMYQQLVYESGGGANGQVEPAGHETSAEPAPQRRMTTTSISLPDNFRMPGAPVGVRTGASNMQPQPMPQQAPRADRVPTQVRPAPSYQGPTAAQSTSYQQAAAFNAQFSRRPGAPAEQNAIGPQMTSPFASVQQAAPAQPQLANPLAVQTSLSAIQPLAAGGPVASHVPPVSPAPQVSPAPVTMHSLQPNAAAAAAIPPAYAAPQAQQQLAAQPGAATTTVSYLSPADSLLWERGQRSFGSQPSSPQAPSMPAVR